MLFFGAVSGARRACATYGLFGNDKSGARSATTDAERNAVIERINSTRIFV
jgi:hypothetical protein